MVVVLMVDVHRDEEMALFLHWRRWPDHVGSGSSAYRLWHQRIL
jgi:hypothetical protein